MSKIIVFGASGNLGFEIVKTLMKTIHETTVVVRSEKAAEKFKNLNCRVVIRNPCNSESVVGICEDQEIVISAFGKSVSPNDRSKPRFEEVDLKGNTNILYEAQKSKVKKFVYISAFHVEKYPRLNYFRVHQEFTDLLIQSGLNYTVIKPPAIFCGFVDFIEMSKKGFLISLGSGEHFTNPIFEGDLAKIVVESLSNESEIIEAGGKIIYSRIQLLELIRSQINPKAVILKIPLWFVKFGFPLLKWFDKNTYDKYMFFLEVSSVDTIAPKLGKMSFEDYLKLKTPINPSSN